MLADPMHRAAPWVVLLVLGLLFVPSCRAPTEITLVVTTDVSCTDLRGTSVTVGRLGEIETKASTTSSTFCDASSGDLGALVVVPSGGKSDEVAVKLVAGVGKDADSCVPPYGKGCIVARRAVHFLPHTPLRIAVPLRAACDGLACKDDETCVSGACVSAEIADPSACAGADGCNEGALGAGAGTDAGVDGGLDGAVDSGDANVTPTTYNDMTQAASWSTFDLSAVSAGAKTFAGATFDGRYVYFAPASDVVGTVARFDTQASFTAAGSWSTFATTTLNPNAKGFQGAAFDGRYVYLVPLATAAFTFDGLAARYDTQASFTAPGSWTTFDTATLDANATGFAGSAFDGRYVYLVPDNNGSSHGIVTRYDTQASFSTAGAWATFDTTTVNASAFGFIHGVFDGRYVYFAPGNNGARDGVLARYDTQGAFTATGSWSIFDVTTVNTNARGFEGAAFDGRYVYLVPYSNAVSTSDGLVVRYDTQAAFDAGGAWSTFDTTSVNAKAVGFAGAAFDGRHVYFLPLVNNGTYDGVVTRYDTLASFGAAGSWSTFDTTTLDPNAKGFTSGVFDGRYLYLASYATPVVARFEAKSPPSMPPLPAFFGSFF
jgi:hypothetical protein